MAKLALIRHGQSEWNALGLWTGWKDIPLNAKGREEAEEAGEVLKNYKFDQAFTSNLQRAQQTLTIILQTLGIDIPVTKSESLNERNYGDLTGKNKWEVKAEIGEVEFMKVRRSWDHPPINGESLKNVYERVKPYYTEKILPLLKEDKNIIISAHGNSLRALIKYLENISDTDIPNLEIGTGEVYLYDINHNGEIANKEILSTNLEKFNI